MSLSKSEGLFDLAHLDVWDPVSIISYDGFKYFVIFINDFSRATWLYLLKSKDEVFDCFQGFVNGIDNQYNGKIKIFWSNNETEFVNIKFAHLFKEKWIIHQTTCIHIPK